MDNAVVSIGVLSLFQLVGAGLIVSAVRQAAAAARGEGGLSQIGALLSAAPHGVGGLVFMGLPLVMSSMAGETRFVLIQLAIAGAALVLLGLIWPRFHLSADDNQRILALLFGGVFFLVGAAMMGWSLKNREILTGVIFGGLFAGAGGTILYFTISSIIRGK
jgi:hypothetical protein